MSATQQAVDTLNTTQRVAAKNEAIKTTYTDLLKEHGDNLREAAGRAERLAKETASDFQTKESSGEIRRISRLVKDTLNAAEHIKNGTPYEPYRGISYRLGGDAIEGLDNADTRIKDIITKGGFDAGQKVQLAQISESIGAANAFLGDKRSALSFGRDDVDILNMTNVERVQAQAEEAKEIENKKSPLEKIQDFSGAHSEKMFAMAGALMKVVDNEEALGMPGITEGKKFLGDVAAYYANLAGGLEALAARKEPKKEQIDALIMKPRAFTESENDLEMTSANSAANSRLQFELDVARRQLPDEQIKLAEHVMSLLDNNKYKGRDSETRLLQEEITRSQDHALEIAREWDTHMPSRDKLMGEMLRQKQEREAAGVSGDVAEAAVAAAAPAVQKSPLIVKPGSKEDNVSLILSPTDALKEFKGVDPVKLQEALDSLPKPLAGDRITARPPTPGGGNGQRSR